MQENWYYTSGKTQRGPVTFEQLKELARNGNLDRFTGLVWHEGLSAWKAAGAVEGLYVGPIPPPLSIPSSHSTQAEKKFQIPKSGSPLPWVAIGLMAVSMLLLAIGTVLAQWHDIELLGDLIIVLHLPFHLAGCIVMVVWIYFAWNTVPPEHRTISPGAAVGLLFVPFFNFYWVFRAIPGLSMRISEVLDAKGCTDKSGPAAFGVAIAASIVWLIPVLNLLSPILFAIWMYHAHRQREALIQMLSEEVSNKISNQVGQAAIMCSQPT